MKTTLMVLAVVIAAAQLAACACSSCPSTNPDCNAGIGGSDGSGGGGAGGGAGSRYTITSIDSTPSDSTYLDMAVDPVQNRVGIAYLQGTGANPDGSLDTPFYHLKYVEWKDGVASAPEDVVPAIPDGGLRRFIGVSIAFDPTTGEPAIAYLGGGADGSLYWFNSDAMVSLRNAGTWTPESVATMSIQGIMCGTAAEPNPVSDAVAGFVVGVWPAIKYDSTGQMHFCYRDVHSGQFPMQDWAGSDVKCRHGDPHNPSAMMGECTQPGGNDKNEAAWGGHIQMIMVNDEPIITYDQENGGADTLGNNVFFQQRMSTGWEAGNHGVVTVANTGDGASLAYDPMVGFGVAVNDQNTGVLFYTSKPPSSGNTWNTPQQVFGAGTGGLFPSLAFDPTFHEPAIAFFICSLETGVADFNSHCQPDHQELRIAQLTSGNWNHEAVDNVAARRLRLGFLPSGKRVLAYRVIQTGEVKLAVEK